MVPLILGLLSFVLAVGRVIGAAQAFDGILNCNYTRQNMNILFERTDIFARRVHIYSEDHEITMP